MLVKINRTPIQQHEARDDQPDRHSRILRARILRRVAGWLVGRGIHFAGALVAGALVDTIGGVSGASYNGVTALRLAR